MSYYLRIVSLESKLKFSIWLIQKFAFYIFFRYPKDGLRSQDRKIRAESSNESGSKERRNQSEDLN